MKVECQPTLARLLYGVFIQSDTIEAQIRIVVIGI
jgi:hypothetical protein